MGSPKKGLGNTGLDSTLLSNVYLCTYIHKYSFSKTVKVSGFVQNSMNENIFFFYKLGFLTIIGHSDFPSLVYLHLMYLSAESLMDRY